MSESLRFEELHVRRSPGFEQEGFTLVELSPGINLIHGPNGAGKSTTARAVARLLWPVLAGSERVSLRGRFRLAGAEWSVDLDGSRVQYQRDGVQAPAPILPSGEGHQRYHLSLHDLLRVKDEGFAAAVARESAGGYDVRQSGEVIDPRAPVSRRNALSDAVTSARAAYDDAVARQQELRAQEAELTQLRISFQAAEAAQRRVTVLQTALEHARAREADEAARVELARFAEGMERVAGGEYERLCRLRDTVRKIEEERREAEKVAAEARSRAETLALPDEALREELLRGLESDLARLEAAEHAVERARSAHLKALARKDSAAVRLRGAVDAERLASADLSSIREVATFASRANALASRRDAVESQLAALGADSDAADLADLNAGMQFLRCWLREPAPGADAVPPHSGWGRIVGIAAAAVLVALGVLLGSAGQPVYWLAALLGLASLALILWPGSPAMDARAVHQREYEKLRLDAPEAWQPGPVETLLEALEDRAAAARAAGVRHARRHGLEQELARIVEEERRCDGERERIAARLGVAPPDTSPVELAWISETLVRWQEAHDEAAAEGVALTDAERSVAELTESLRARLDPLGYAELGTIGALAGAIHAFGERRRALQTEREKLANAEASLRRLQDDREGRETEIAQLFEALGLDADSDDTVKSWCDERSEYRRVHEASRRAETVLAAVRSRLDASGAEEALSTLPPHEVQAQVDLEMESASKRDGLARDITATETRIAEAKRSHNVEEALERLEYAREELRRAREKEARSAVAQELVDALERATRDQHLPAVFRRAREIFTRITHGRYELRLAQEEVPEFTAFDHIDRQGRRLEELSSGTRVQLLLAVRIAFVEQQEQGVMLPLLLDEVLGNSDDERARAIMEAAVELAREGRQIFYFTAQADEVARWRMLLADGGEAEVALQEIDLHQVRRLERRLEIPAMFPAVRATPPAPDGVDDAEYGRRLKVPRLDRAGAETSTVHLWYVVDEPEVLHRLLMLGQEKWGALRSLVRDGGRPLVEEGMLGELEARGRVVEAFLEAARVGVGRRVDRAVLEDSGAVTATFLDRVEDLAGALGGDASLLMEALEEGAVARFSQKSKDGLRDYLEAGGYLAVEEPLGLQEIRTRVLSRIADDVAGGLIGIDRVDCLVSRLWVGIGGGSGSPPRAQRS